MSASTDVGSQRLLAGNPVSDVRGSIAKLTARARNLLENTDTRVTRNRWSVYETSKTLSSQATHLSRIPVGTSQAPVELFMSSLGFNVQEQQRLLNQLQAQQPAMSAMAATLPVAGSGGSELGGWPPSGAPLYQGSSCSDPQSELEVFLAARRNEVIEQCVEDSHRFVVDRVREHMDAAVRLTWEMFSLEVSDSFEVSAVKSGSASALRRSQHPFNSSRPELAGESSGTGAHWPELLGSDQSVAMVRKMQRATTFASIVGTQPPRRWLADFTSFAVDAGEGAEGDDAKSLWCTLEELLLPLAQESTPDMGAPASTSKVLGLVASSRHVMERRAFRALLADVLKVEAPQFEEMENMHSSRVKSIVERYASTSNPWVRVYLAMRIGRYDTATLIAGEMGLGAVESALAVSAGTVPSLRNQVQAVAALRPLYKEPATRTDPYRCLVLFLLLVGSTGEEGDVALSALLDAVGRVSSTLEEMLWARMCCVRVVDAHGADEATREWKVQSLTELQRLMMEDLQDLVLLVNGNTPRLASLLFHALLPSTALRLLVEDEHACVDGIHMALCHRVSGLLRCTSAESPLDLESHLRHYCANMLLDADKRPLAAVRAESTIFSYFSKTGYLSEFVEMCCNDVVAARLFGQPTTHVGRVQSPGSGALLHGVPSAELLSVMEAIANACDGRGNTELAVHMLTVLEAAATTAGKPAVAVYALQRAVQVIRPVLSQNAHRHPTEQSSSALLIALKLQEQLRRSTASIPSTDADAFDVLCSIAAFFARVATGDVEAAAMAFVNLPFIPRCSPDVSRSLDALADAADDVSTAIPPTVLTGMRALVSWIQSLTTARRSAEAVALKAIAKAVVEWQRRWERSRGRDITAHMIAFEEQLSA